MKEVDALFVINQDSAFDHIADKCKKLDLKSIFILSTQSLFTHEKLQLKEMLSNIHIEFSIFPDFINDHEMENCDIDAQKNIFSSFPDTYHQYYPGHFFNLSLTNKNQMVLDKLKKVINFSCGFFSEGLGISTSVWSKHLLPLEQPENKTNFLSKVFSRAHSVKEKLFKPKTFYVIDLGDTSHVFITNIKRIDLNESAQVRAVPFSKLTVLLNYLKSPRNDLENLIKQIPDLHSNIRIATTIHEFSADATATCFPLDIFSDGYHAPNYPQSYVETYFSGTIITRDMFDEMWFGKYGKPTAKPYPFTKTRFFNTTNPERAVNRVCLALNHAGDWSSIINRSDTDLLTEAFCEIAANHPGLAMVVRPHPTMAHPLHEGSNSLNRIGELVTSYHLNNLTLSTVSLDEDMSSADLLVSEYSNVILDGLQHGKLCIIANVTHRRNLMQAYTDLGFITATSQSELDELIERSQTDHDSLISEQNKAVEAYNKALTDFYQ